MKVDLTRIIELCKSVFPDGRVQIYFGADMYRYDHNLNVELSARGSHVRIHTYADRGVPEDQIARELCRGLAIELMRGV